MLDVTTCQYRHRVVRVDMHVCKNCPLRNHRSIVTAAGVYVVLVAVAIAAAVALVTAVIVAVAVVLVPTVNGAPIGPCI